jgi:hypothetical protein
MIRHELTIEEREATGSEPRHQPRQGHLGCVATKREHAFAKEGPTQSHTVKPSHQIAVRPAFDGMGVSEPVKQIIARLDLPIYPGLFAIGTMFDDLRKRPISGDVEHVSSDDLRQ